MNDTSCAIFSRFAAVTVRVPDTCRVTLKNRSFTAFGVSRSEIGIAGRNVTVTPWSGCDGCRGTVQCDRLYGLLFRKETCKIS